MLEKLYETLSELASGIYHVKYSDNVITVLQAPSVADDPDDFEYLWKHQRRNFKVATIKNDSGVVRVSYGKYTADLGELDERREYAVCLMLLIMNMFLLEDTNEHAVLFNKKRRLG